jgi:hypothetical protein
MAQTSVTNYIKGGLQPSRKLGSGYNSKGLTHYSIKNGEAQAIYKGDPVHLSAGYVRVLPSIGAPILGVFMGCAYVDPNSKQPTWSNKFPAATSMEGGQYIDNYNNPRAYVIDDPDMIYYVKSDHTSVSAGDIGTFGSHLVSVGEGSDLYGQSRAKLSVGHVGLARPQLQIVGLASFPGSEFDATDTVLEVVIAQHQLRRGSGLVPATVA